jgi:TPR repeat protein
LGAEWLPAPKVEAPKVVKPKEEIVEPIVKVKEETPFEIAKKSCLSKNAQGCIDFGWIMINKKDYTLAESAFSLAYDYGYKDKANRGFHFIGCTIDEKGKSCHSLGLYLEKGWGGNQDYILARKYYHQSIDLGSNKSLGSLAHLYAKGLGGEKSQVKATKLFKASCNAGATDVNYENCYNAGVRYDNGKGVRQDKFKAVKLYQKACSGGYADGCGNLGWMYSYGKGVRQSKSTALMYYGKACDLGSDLGCTNYAKSNK